MKNKNKKKDMPDLDLFLLEKIQPQGGIVFKDESYIRTGTGYECCVHIYEFPSDASENWLRAVSNIKDSITQIDIATDNINEVKRNINKSLKEQNSRIINSSSWDEEYNAKKRAKEIQALYKEISNMGEVVKLVSIRIFLADRSLIKLEEKVKKLIDILETNRFRAAIYLNETKNEWMSMYRNYTKQQALPFSVAGQGIVASALAIGNPFHFSSLEDPYGSYLGHTPCGGAVLFDEFTKTKNRLYYNSLCVGPPGTGKSTLLKKRFDDRTARADYVRVFDITGEFETLTKSRGGKIIKLDGLHGMLNPLEILRAGESEVTSFQRHITKTTIIYKYLEPSATSQETTMYANLMRDLYEEWNLNPEINNKEHRITGLPANSYPIYSDLLEFIKNRMKEIADKDYNEVELEVAKQEILILNKIKNTTEQLVTIYGSIFDGYTSMDNIHDEQIVTFNLSQLKEMDSRIFDAQIFNMVSLCWDNCVTNGQLMLDAVNAGKIKSEDIVKFLILIDESHRWINTSKSQALDMIMVYLREARKYFGAIMMASQSIRDFVPEGSAEESINKIKTIFELTQYKFIFHQDNNVMKLIDNVFQNSLTPSQKARIPNLEVGENILCISGERNIEFHVDITDEEKRLFTGGV